MTANMPPGPSKKMLQLGKIERKFVIDGRVDALGGQVIDYIRCSVELFTKSKYARDSCAEVE